MDNTRATALFPHLRQVARQPPNRLAKTTHIFLLSRESLFVVGFVAD